MLGEQLQGKTFVLTCRAKTGKGRPEDIGRDLDLHIVGLVRPISPHFFV
jgi:hypothetical protein